jgi:GDPmannose 4,6-dehydratase
VCKEAVKIKLGLSNELKLGNIDATRDWGHAKDYVKAMWEILQLEQPDDFVCSTGISHSVRELVNKVFCKLEMNYEEHVIQDKKYMRPQELPYLKGDSDKIRKALGWEPKISFDEMIDEMIVFWDEKLRTENVMGAVS